MNYTIYRELILLIIVGTAMEFLSMHPDVVVARRDNNSMELHFFGNDELYRKGQGVDWYRYCLKKLCNSRDIILIGRIPIPRKVDSDSDWKIST